MYLSKNQKTVIKAVKKSKPSWSDVEDGVSICYWVSKNCGIEIMLKTTDAIQGIIHEYYDEDGNWID